MTASGWSMVERIAVVDQQLANDSAGGRRLYRDIRRLVSLCAVPNCSPSGPPLPGDCPARALRRELRKAHQIRKLHALQ